MRDRNSDLSPSRVGSETARITEIDFIRGAMLISMAIDHGSSLTRLMGRNAASPPTIAQIIPSTTAEVFFLMSGYMLGHARLAKLGSINVSFVLETWKRAWHLYAYNAVTMIVAAAVMIFAGPKLLEASRFDQIASHPFHAIGDFVLLRSAPFGFDVLQLYIIYFMFTPVFVALMMKSRAGALMWLGLCWLGVEIWVATIGLEHDETIAINIWAWQITFFGGMMLGIGRRYGAIARTILANPIVVRVAFVFLAIMAVAWLGQRYPHRLGLQEAPWTMPGVDRASLGPLKILSSLCVIVVLIWFSHRVQIMRTWIGQTLAVLGRHSLTSFCASNLGIYGVALAWQNTESNAVFWLAEALLVAFVFAWVSFTVWLNQTGVTGRAPATGVQGPSSMPSETGNGGSSPETAAGRPAPRGVHASTVSN